MTQTANNYGEVLFELGIKKDTVEESKRIFSLTEQLHRTLESPIISKNEKYSIIEKVFPKEIENFLKVVCDHEKMSYIDEIIEAYYKKYNEANNILTATLSYVVEPNDNQLSQIKNYLAKKYNKYTGEEIKLTPHILTYLLYEHGEHGNATKRISTLWGIKIS